MGITQNNSSQLGGTKTSCKQAIVLKPDFAKPHYNLGILLYGISKSEKDSFSFQGNSEGKFQLYSFKKI